MSANDHDPEGRHSPVPPVTPQPGKPSTAELPGIDPRAAVSMARTLPAIESVRPPPGPTSQPDSYAAAPGEPAVTKVEPAVGELELEDTVWRYDEGPLLGSGGMGEVRLQRDRRIGRAVALKMMHAHVETPDTKQRFLREARVQGQLEHPAIVPVYDLGRREGRLYFTMKRVRGITLARILHGLSQRDEAFVRKFPRRRLVAAMLQVCRAIHYAHTRGIVHRDLKPSNIMIGDFGEVYVLDWGLARALDEPVASVDRRSMVAADPSALKIIKPNFNLTKPGNLVGTLSYMAPEQARGEQVDPRADIYALGVMLYEIFTLKRFRDDGNYVRVVAMIVDGVVARPSDHVSDVDPGLDELCVKATQVEREDRFQTCEEMSLALERWLDGERDTSTKRALAARHLTRARELLATEGAAGAEERLPSAMHELLRAMSLDEEGPDVQRALVQVLSDTSGRSLPAEAEADLQASRARERAEGNLTVTVAVTLLLGAPLAAASIVLLGQPILAAAVAVLVLASAFLFLRTVQRLRARLDDAERRAALQTWHLRQLFPSGWRDRNSRPG